MIRITKRQDTSTHVNKRGKFISMGTMGSPLFGLTNSEVPSSHLEFSLECATSGKQESKPKEDLYVLPVSKKSSFQQQPIQKTGGQNQESITRILTNYGGDLPKSTTFQKYPWDTPILNLSLTQKVSTPNSPIRSTERLKPCTREQEKNTMPLTECSDAMSTESPEFSPNSPILYLRNQEPLDWISPIPLAQDDSIDFTTNNYQDFW